MTAIEKRLCAYMAQAIQVCLQVDPSQTQVSVKKLKNANWVNWPFYQIVPGAARPYGAGRGSQEGGACFITQKISCFVFTKAKFDQYSFSDKLLSDEELGVQPIFDSLRALFKQTYFGNPDGTNCLLIEPLFLASEGETIWEDPETSLVSREFTWDAQYADDILSPISVTLPQVLNAEA